MKGSILDSLSYTGTVTLSQYVGKKRFEVARVKNAGNAPLFDFLANCLAGNFDLAEPERPVKIMLLQQDGEELTSRSDFLWLLTNPERVDVGKVRYSFIVPNSWLTSSNSFNAIGLYTRNADLSSLSNYAAICGVKDASNNISPSAVLVVDWELSVANRPSNIKGEL